MYRVENTSARHAGRYKVRVENAAGRVVSDVVKVTVN
jgi:hypothetical protein